jgi:hypothetical protein
MKPVISNDGSEGRAVSASDIPSKLRDFLGRARTRFHTTSERVRTIFQNGAFQKQMPEKPVLPPEVENTHEIYYFLHIPKTAGVSVSRYLTEAFTKEATFSGSFVRDLSEFTRADLLKKKLFVGHIGLPDPFLGRKTRKITFLRDPFDRAVSNILHKQRYEPSLLSELVRQYSVEQVLTNPAFAWIHSNYQARYIATLAFSVYSLVDMPPEGHGHPHHLMERLYYELFSGSGLLEVCQTLLGQFDFIGLTEYTKLSLLGVAEAWRLPYPSREYKENTNPDRANYAEMVSETVRREFYRLNEVDYELYNLVKKRLVRGES